MSAESIITEWKKHKFRPVYWLEGEEEYFIDKVVDYAEHNILNESEAGFNLTVFYGRDANWADVINACMRYPMFAERQVVLLKEAQQMRDLDKLEPYIGNPLTSTIFVVSHKEKKVDGRSKLAKLLKDKAVVLTTKKLYENQLPEWTQEMVQSKGFSISTKGLMLLVDHIGNDLTRIENEIDKISVNLGGRNNITEEDIENFVGISKDFNVFELQSALAHKDFPKAIRIIQYFEANPKAAPIQMILPALYSFFSKVYMMFGTPSRDPKSLQSIGLVWNGAKEAVVAEKNYGFEGIEKTILLFHHYNLRSIGVNDAGTEDASLLKEMVVKLMA